MLHSLSVCRDLIQNKTAVFHEQYISWHSGAPCLSVHGRYARTIACCILINIVHVLLFFGLGRRRCIVCVGCMYSVGRQALLAKESGKRCAAISIFEIWQAARPQPVPRRQWHLVQSLLVHWRHCHGARHGREAQQRCAAETTFGCEVRGSNATGPHSHRVTYMIILSACYLMQKRKK